MSKCKAIHREIVIEPSEDGDSLQVTFPDGTSLSAVHRILKAVEKLLKACERETTGKEPKIKWVVK